MNKVITFDGTKTLDTNEIRRRFVQGENLADKVVIRGPRQVGRLDLAELKIILRADNEEYSASIEQELIPQIESDQVALTWEVDERFTACSGFADLTLIGYSGTDEVIKITSDGVFVRKNGPAGGGARYGHLGGGFAGTARRRGHGAGQRHRGQGQRDGGKGQ